MTADNPPATAIELIAAERARQVSAEGWTAEHDDEHDRCEIAYAAIAYTKLHCLTSGAQFGIGAAMKQVEWMEWPAHWGKFKGSPEPIRNLVKAGALIAAEIDRLQRRTPAPATGDE